MWKAATLLGLTLAGAPPLIAQTGPAQSEVQTVDAQLVRRYREAEVAYGKGREHFERKDFEGTRRELGACFQSIPSYPDAHFLLAKVFYIEKDYPQALKAIERAKAGYRTLATILATLQEDRLSEMRTRIQEQADLAAAFGRWISRPEPEGREIDRILYAQRSDRNELPAEYSFFHGNVLLRLNRPAEAAAQYEEALKTDPACGEAANNLAALYHSARLDEKAREVVTKAESNGVVVNSELKNEIDIALGPSR